MADPKGRVTHRTQRSGVSIMNDEVLKDLPKPKPKVSPRVSVKTSRPGGASVMRDEVLKDLDAKKVEAPKASPKPSSTALTRTNPVPATTGSRDVALSRGREVAGSGGRDVALSRGSDVAGSGGRSVATASSVPAKTSAGASGSGPARFAQDLAGEFKAMGRAGEDAAVKKAADRLGRYALKAIPGVGIASTIADITSPTPVADATIRGNPEAEAEIAAMNRPKTARGNPGAGTSAGRSDYKASEEKPKAKPAAPASKPAPKAPAKSERKPSPGLSEADKISQLTAKGYSREDATKLARAQSTKVTSGPAFSKGGLVGSGKPKADPKPPAPKALSVPRMSVSGKVAAPAKTKPAKVEKFSKGGMVGSGKAMPMKKGKC